VSTKTVFLQQGYVGGDGGSDTDLYYGREMPSLVIYTDGQVIFEEGNSRESYFLETTISPDEMCNLLSELQDFGFYDRYDPIYAFDETTRYSDGGPDGIVQVNGQLSKSLIFYASYRDYLVPPLKQAVEFIGSYRPSTNAYYIPERLVLWVEVATEPLPENVVAESWPDTLPNITELWQDPINGELLIEGELVAPIMALFDYRMTGKAFSDEGVVYGMILRPLLPNESPYPQLWYYHDYAPQSFNLPFACPDLDLPTIDPTPIPAPLPTHEPVAELTGKGRILFDSNRDGNSDIYVMNADGTNLLNLTNHLAKDEMATWSPDGQKIAFVSDRDGNQELYLMNADGTNVTRLTHSPADEIAPEWSPDGKQIIFMSDRLTASIYDISNWQLFVVDVETGVDYQFTEMSFAEGMYSPAWSPDGEKVLFSSRVGNTSQIFMMDKNGENKKWLIAGAGAVWSPDGKQIAFLEIRDRGDYQIFVMKADGTDARQITRFARYTNSLDWSPDGEYLLYSSIRADGGQGAIYAVSTAGEAQPIQLTFYSVDSNSPDWSP
jgi:TolB protein